MVARAARLVSNDPMNIRSLTVDDAPAWFALRLEMLESGPGIFSASVENAREEGVRHAQERLDLAPDDGGVFGAFASTGVLVGAVGWRRSPGPKTRHKAFVWGMYVRPGWRRKGLGFDLMMRLVDTVRVADDIEVLQLCVTSEAAAARALYERLGFQQWGHERSAMKIDGRRIDEFHYAMRVG